MQLSCDSFGFPTLQIEGQRSVFAALPFTKVQFELLWVEKAALRQQFDDAWYKTVLDRNPRSSWRKPPENSLAGLWLTGISPSEAAIIVEQMPDAALPRADEWLEIQRSLSAHTIHEDIGKLRGLPLHPAASAILDRLQQNRSVTVWADLLLINGGILEWVVWDSPGWREKPSGFGALGSPPGTVVEPHRDGPSRYRVGEQPSRLNGFRPCFRLR